MLDKVISKKYCCPACKEKLNFLLDGKIICKLCSVEYPRLHGCPVLLSQDNKIFSLSEYTKSASQQLKQRSKLTKIAPQISVNLASRRVLNHFGSLFPSNEAVFVLVVGGGQQRQWLDKWMEPYHNIQLVYCDIDINAFVDCYCDAHELPFSDQVFDGVITTAVLEHVLYPEKVSNEIARVIKLGGILYSELPFMQQVHEGAYDFTRYTLSGHRRLFNTFEKIDSGMVAGPGTVLIWSIESFFVAFSSKAKTSSVIKVVVRTAFFWLKYFDYYFKNRPRAMDGASCTYLLGKRVVKKIDDQQIIQEYIGGKSVRHV